MFKDPEYPIQDRLKDWYNRAISGSVVPAVAALCVAAASAYGIREYIDDEKRITLDLDGYIYDGSSVKNYENTVFGMEGFDEWGRAIIEEEIAKAAAASSLENSSYGWGGINVKNGRFTSSNALLIQYHFEPLAGGDILHIGEDHWSTLSRLSKEEAIAVFERAYERISAEVGKRLEAENDFKPVFSTDKEELERKRLRGAVGVPIPARN